MSSQRFLIYANLVKLKNIFKFVDVFICFYFLLQFKLSNCDSVPNLQKQIEDEISQLFVNFKHAYYMTQVSEIIEWVMKRVIQETNDFSMEKTDMDRVFRNIKTGAMEKVKNFSNWKY